MPKQSATNPRFRCNGHKDYHSAPDKNVHYQCAVHGYVCKTYRMTGKSKGKSVDKCKVMHNKKYDWGYFEETCKNLLIKFNWHEDVNRWIEEGREEEEKARAKPKVKSKTKPDYLKEINVLVDLLEDDTLTKEVFIKKIREKLK